MTIHHRRPWPARAARAWRALFCIGVVLTTTSYAPAETIDAGGYDSWRWNGFIRASDVEASSSVALLSSSSPAAVTNGETAGAASYSAWQCGGFSRSDSSYPTSSSAIKSADSVSEIIASSKSSLMLSADTGEDAAVSTSLSGYVFYDENGNGKMETTDWAIIDAKVELAKEGSGTKLSMFTNSKGEYSFQSLSPGTYSISLLTPCPAPGFSILGKLYDAGGHPVSDAGKATEDRFYDIVIKDGYQGINYIFGESEYPCSAVSKRLLINGGPEHSAPEPSTLILLAAAGLVFGLFYVRRK